MSNWREPKFERPARPLGPRRAELLAGLAICIALLSLGWSLANGRKTEEADEQAAAINAIVDGLSDEELEKPMPEKFQRFGPDVAHLFAFLPSHWTMHAGQWAIIRRKLGKPPLF